MKTIKLLTSSTVFRSYTLSTCPHILDNKKFIHSGIFKINNKFCCFHETEIDPSDIATLFLMDILTKDSILVRTSHGTLPDQIYRIKNAGISSQ